MGDHDWVSDFTKTFEQPESRVQARVWAEVLGDEYPAELAPYSYTTRSELRMIAEALHVTTGDLLVDIGCGRGGPGLWVAATTGASYLGVDIADSALRSVETRVELLGLAGRAHTEQGHFGALPVADASVDAIMSIDALLFASDKQAAADEMARVLRSGGRLVATTWDYHSQPVGRPPQVSDHRPLLAEAGLDVDVYDETPDWYRRQRAIVELLLANVDALAAETEEDPSIIRAELEEMGATQEVMSRRVLIVAIRR